jgi:hypothetical protein
MDTDSSSVMGTLRTIAKTSITDPISLVKDLPDKQTEKHDVFLNEDLLNQEFAAKKLDLPGAYKAIHELLNGC